MRNIVLAGEAGGEARYRLLETIRRDAHERPIESGEFDIYQRAHARYHLGLAEQAWSGGYALSLDEAVEEVLVGAPALC